MHLYSLFSSRVTELNVFINGDGGNFDNFPVRSEKDIGANFVVNGHQSTNQPRNKENRKKMVTETAKMTVLYLTMYKYILLKKFKRQLPSEFKVHLGDNNKNASKC